MSHNDYIKHIEEENKKIAEIVRDWNIKPGDFINLRTWFGDVWAEVKSVTMNYITYYRNDFPRYITSMESMHEVRKLCRKENVSNIETCLMKTSHGTIHAKYPMKDGAYEFEGDENMKRCLFK